MAAEETPRRPVRVTVYLLLVGVPVLAGLVLVAPRDAGQADLTVLAWIVMIAVVELLPVRSSGDTDLTISFPLLLAVAMLYPPVAAGAITYLASFSPDELRGPFSLPRLLFNRGQNAVAILVASACFHAVATVTSAVWLVMLGLALAAVAAYGVNMLLILIPICLEERIGPWPAIRLMHGPRPVEFLASYLGIGLLGVVFAQLTVQDGLWPVVVLLAVIVLARQLYFRSRALAERLEVQNDTLAKQSEELKRLLDQVQHLAYHDPLTGLANRALFMERIERAVAGDRPAGLLFVDLDEFKQVNDTLGHQLGDTLLVTVAERLSGCAGPEDLVARLGGDEFALLLEGNDAGERGAGIAERLPGVLAEPIELPGVRLTTGGSIGVAVAEPGRTAEELLRRADVAMYAAKAAGKGRAAIWRPELDLGPGPVPPERRRGGRAART